MPNNHKENSNLLSCYIGTLIREIRLNKKLTEKDLANLLNISQQQISRYERGKVKVDVEFLFKIIIVFQLDDEEKNNFLKKISDKI
ncbi:helix-turn-helix domain-containing protein [Proteus mirabilis]|uniref:helix-turn-helix domain-containing protein n=1 Tax=Proteus mirabilis TaxID=584 RepID=UPI0034E4318F